MPTSRVGTAGAAPPPPGTAVPGAPVSGAPALPAPGPAAEVVGLGRRYHSTQALDGVDLSVPAGGIVGLLGPNGAGKTTLVRHLVGLLRPQVGSVRLFGAPLVAPHVGRLVAYLPQDDAAVADLPVRDAVRTTARLRGLSRAAADRAADAVLDELGLGAHRATVLGRLSGGQRRAAAVATALVGERPLLILDEPTTGLDPAARQRVWSALARRRDSGVTILLVTHNVLEAETVVDRVVILGGGRVIADDTPGRLKASVSSAVRLQLVWRLTPTPELLQAAPRLAALAPAATVSGRRWQFRLPAAQARAVLAEVTAGPALDALDDFTLSTPSLEDVYLTLGGAQGDFEVAA